MPSIPWQTIKDCIHTWFVLGSGLPANRVIWEGQNMPEPTGSTQAWISLGRPTWTNPGSDWTETVHNPLAFADKTFTLNAGTDQATCTAHGLTTRTGPVRVETSGSLAGSGLATGTDYWVIRDSDDTLKFAASFLDANVGTFIDITGVGTGTHSIVSTADTVKSGEELMETAYGLRRFTMNVTCFPKQPDPHSGAVVGDAEEAHAILSDVVAYSVLTVQAERFFAANVGLLDAGSPQAIGGVQNAVYFEPRATLTIAFTATSAMSAPVGSLEYVNAEDEDMDQSITVTADFNLPPGSV